MPKKKPSPKSDGYPEPLKSLGADGLRSKANQDCEAGTLTPFWRDAVVALCQVTPVVKDDKVEEAVEAIYKYLNQRLGLEGTRKTFKYRAGATGGRHCRQRYRDCRAQGYDHEQALDRMKQAVEWGIRFHGHEQNNWRWINPVTTFRVQNWEMRQ